MKAKDIAEQGKALRDKATQGEWEYGGMEGDPGKLLRHFIKINGEHGQIVSTDFQLDYSTLQYCFPFIAFAANHFTELAEAYLELLQDYEELAVKALKK